MWGLRLESFDSAQANGSSDSIPSPPQSVVPVPPSELAKTLATTLNNQLSTPDDEIKLEKSEETGEPTYFDSPPACPSPARQVVTAPATPTGRTTPRRGIQFSPRLEVHETWHSAEYDRRGEPATCNRLTAQLAQMIKEELNAFKMQEMVVHEVLSSVLPHLPRYLSRSYILLRVLCDVLMCCRKVDLTLISFDSMGMGIGLVNWNAFRF